MARFKETQDTGNGKEYYIFTGYPALLGFVGFLGLHFLKQFNEVCFDRSTGLLTVKY